MNVPVAWALSSGHFGWSSIPRYGMALASEEVPRPLRGLVIRDAEAARTRV
jgi:hypothetical protein